MLLPIADADSDADELMAMGNEDNMMKTLLLRSQQYKESAAAILQYSQKQVVNMFNNTRKLLSNQVLKIISSPQLAI